MFSLTPDAIFGPSNSCPHASVQPINTNKASLFLNAHPPHVGLSVFRGWTPSYCRAAASLSLHDLGQIEEVWLGAPGIEMWEMVISGAEQGGYKRQAKNVTLYPCGRSGWGLCQQQVRTWMVGRFLWLELLGHAWQSICSFFQSWFSAVDRTFEPTVLELSPSECLSERSLLFRSFRGLSMAQGQLFSKKRSSAPAAGSGLKAEVLDSYRPR